MKDHGSIGKVGRPPLLTPESVGRFKAKLEESAMEGKGMNTADCTRFLHKLRQDEAEAKGVNPATVDEPSDETVRNILKDVGATKCSRPSVQNHRRLVVCLCLFT